MPETHSGGCQCGKVRYEVQMDIGEVLACNCSRCGRLGSLLGFAPASQFKLLSGEADLTKFEFNKHMIEHQFCSTCGIQSFAIGTHPKSGEKMAAINVRCLDGVDVETLKVKKVDGKRL
ncbi:MAG: GFA family protein [Steroidobacteraceae bacterium]